jgi:hypothetical protein
VDPQSDPFVLLVGNLHKANDLKGDAGREAALLALGAVVAFLESLPDVKRCAIHAPLLTLFEALADLDKHGVVHPMFLPEKRSNALPSDRAKLHAVAAAWAEALIQTGAGRDAADARVALELGRLGYTPRGEKRGRISHETVRQWRKEARQPASSGVNAEMYAQMRQAFQGMDRSTLNAAIPPMLRNIVPHLFSPSTHLGEKG